MPNRRAARTRAEVAIRRAFGGKRRRRKRVPRQIYPKGVEREYARALLRIVRQAQDQLKPLLEELPSMVEAAAHDRTVLDSARLDAGEGRRIYELIEIARESLRRAMSVGALDALSREFAQKVETWQRIQMGKQVRSVLGVDVFAGDPGLAAASEAFTASNVSLIRNLPQRMYDEIETLVQEQVRVGALHKDIAKQIQDRFGIAERRAKLIARDQVGKYYGAVQEQRQKALGVERFIWRTSNDERVRPEHAAREGVEYSWGNPPEGGPGQPVNCRCYAEPVLDDLVG